MTDKTIFEVKTPRTGEETPEAMAQVLASLASIKAPSGGLFSKFDLTFSLELVLSEQAVKFFVVVPTAYSAFIESQLLSQYPKALITQLSEDYLDKILENQSELSFGQMKLQNSFIYPLKTYTDFKDVDPLSSLLGMLSKIEQNDFALIQITLSAVGSGWQAVGQKLITKKKDLEADPGAFDIAPFAKLVQDKINYPGFKTGIRVVTKSSNPALINLIAATFTTFNSISGNSLYFSNLHFWQKKNFLKALKLRTSDITPNEQILNIIEIATLFHFPGLKLSNIKNVSWSRTILSDPPENLPVSTEITEEEKKDVNFFAKTEYKNKMTTFGIKRADRRKHVYIIGKTGTGKSTLIANMIIADIRNGEGVAVIDPHGDLCEIILDYIPSYRINDVIYLNPSDLENPFHLNPLEVAGSTQKELIASGIVSIFYKLYGNSWGPRLEYILRNTLLTLVDVPNATLLMVPEILNNAKFRKKIEEGMKDPVLKSFWINEYDKMSEQLRVEAVSSILNKVGQFLSSQMIRNIVGFPKSTINLEDVMNDGKILLLNLSQGKIGEDSSSLLGAMIITKMQLAAMNRVNIPEADRRDFYLYVDEFQNFATTSFIKILSEARKYHLDLTLANQYIDQIIPEVRSAIFGNAGTIMNFIIGAGDAPFMVKEFGERFKLEDLLSLGKYQILLKMSIDGITCSPFVAQTLPLPQSRTQSREKIIRVSRERYTTSQPANSELEMDKFVVDTNPISNNYEDHSSDKLKESSKEKPHIEPHAHKKHDNTHNQHSNHQKDQQSKQPHIPPPSLNSREMLRRTIK